MKMRKRALCLWICLALMISVAPVDSRLLSVHVAEAEDEIAAEAFDAPPADERASEPASEPAPAEQPDGATDGGGSADAAATDEPAPEADRADEAKSSDESARKGEAEAGESSEAPEIDYAADAGASPAFSTGYAEVLRDGAPVFADETGGAEAKAELGAGVVYATGRSALEGGPDRLRIAYNAGPERGVDVAWIDAEMLRPMEPGREVPAYIAYCNDLDGVICCEELDGLPLARISCADLEAPEGEAAEPNDEPEDGEGKETGEGTKESSDGEPASDSDMAEGAPPVILYDLPEGDISTMPLPLENPVIRVEDIAPAAEGDPMDSTENPANAPGAQENPTSVSMRESLALGLGMSAGLGVSFLPEGSASACEFSCEPEGVVELRPDGRVTAIGLGEATISLRTANGLGGSCRVRVVDDAAIEVDSEIDVALGEAGIGISAAAWADGAEIPCDFCYEVIDGASCVDVEPDTGLLTPKAPGNAVVRVSAVGAEDLYSELCAVTVTAALEGLELGVDSLEMRVNEISRALEDAAAGAGCTFRSSNSEIASVSGSGRIAAKRAGACTISVSSKDGKSANLPVRVVRASYNLTAESTSLGVGMRSSVTCDGASGVDVRYVCEPEGVIEFSADGSFEAVRPGEAVVYAKAGEGAAQKFSNGVMISVLPAPAGDQIQFSSESADRVYAGQSGTQVSAACADGTMADLKYRLGVGAPSGVSIDADTGELTIGSAAGGSFAVEAYDENHQSVYAAHSISIVQMGRLNSLRRSTLKLVAGEKYQLGDGPEGIIKPEPEDATGKYKFESLNKAVAKVSDQGLITAVKKGSALIRITDRNDKSIVKYLTVQISKKNSAVSLSPAVLTLGVGMSANLTPSSGVLELASSNESAVSVDALGIVTALSEGEATITATDPASGRSDTALVRVLAHPSGLEIENAQIVMGVGEKNVKASASIIPAGGSEPVGTVAYELVNSKDKDYVTINKSTGALTAKKKTKAGQAISVRAYIKEYAGEKETMYALADVTVVQKTSISLTTKSVKLGVGNAYYILPPEDDSGEEGESDDGTLGIVKVKPKSALANTKFSFKSSDTGVASVNAKGRITAKKAGTAKITISTQSKRSASLTVRVYKRAKSMSLNCETMELCAGMAKTLSVKFPSNTYDSYTFSSDDEGIATVDPDSGKVLAIAEGETVVSASTENGLEASCIVSVLPVTQNIHLSIKRGAETIQLEDGDTLTVGAGEKNLTLVAKPDEGYSGNFKFKLAENTAANRRKLSVNASSGKLNVKMAGEVELTAYEASNADSVQATITVEILKKPAKMANLTLSPSSIKLGLGERFQISESGSGEVGGLIRLAKGYAASYSYKSSDKGVVTVSSKGLVKAVGTGSAKIRITTQNPAVYKDLTVKVVKKPTAIQITPSLSLGSGMSATITPSFTPSSAFGSMEVTSSSEDLKVSCSATSGKITLKAGEIDTRTSATLTVRLPYWDLMDICVVDLLPAPQAGGVEFDYENIPAAVLQDGEWIIRMEQGANNVTLKAKCSDPETMSKFTYALTSGSSSGLSVGKTSGKLTANKTGEYQVTATSVSNPDAEAVATIKVTARKPTYRALMISEYDQRNGNLPFTGQNVLNMQTALKRSNIGGKTYSTKVLRDPYKSTIQSSIKSFFKDTVKNDISILYITAHGHMGTGSHANSFCFSLGKYVASDRSTYVTDGELMSWIRTYIKGRVLLVLDNCNSGAFIDQQKSTLKKLGNVAVIAAQKANKTASFYVGTYKNIKTQEFFTRAFYTGLGYQTSKGDKWDSAGSADGGDGKITISEIFKYSKSTTTQMVNKYCNTTYFNANSDKGFKSPGLNSNSKLTAWYAKGSSQIPRYYIPSGMGSLVFFGLS